MKIEILDVIRGIVARIEQEEKRLLRLRLLIAHCTAELDGMPHGNTPVSRVENLAVNIFDCEQTIKQLRTIEKICTVELSDWLDEVLTDETERTVLFLRYGLCRSFGMIAEELGYSERMIFRFHRRAVSRLVGEC